MELFIGLLICILCHILFIYLFLIIPRGTWDISSLTRDGTSVLCIGSKES